MHEHHLIQSGIRLMSPPLGFNIAALFLLVAIPSIILSVGAINALIPIMIIIILIAAAAGSTRNFSFFNIFGISQLLSGLGSYGGGSRGSMAKSGYSMRAYLDPYIRHVARKRNKGGMGNFEKQRRDTVKNILLEARGIRGTGKGGAQTGPEGRGGTPSGPGSKGGASSQNLKANILLSQTAFGAFGSTVKGTATRLKLMKAPSMPPNEAEKPPEEKKPEINISPSGMHRLLAPFRWGLAKSMQDQFRAFKPKISESDISPPPRPFGEQMASKILLYGQEGRRIKTRQESIDEKKTNLKKMEDEYNKRYNASDIVMVFTPTLDKKIDPLRLISSDQRQNSRNAWKARVEIQQLRAQIWVEENEVNKGKTDTLYTGHMEDALEQLKIAKEAYKAQMEQTKKLWQPNKYKEIEKEVKKVDTLIAQGNNILNAAPLMHDRVTKRLELVEQYTGRQEKKPDTENESSASDAAGSGIISDLKDRYEKGMITEKQFDLSYARIYNKLYGPVDKSVMHHVTNKFYSNYLLGITRTSDKPSGYAELVKNFLKSAATASEKATKKLPSPQEVVRSP